MATTPKSTKAREAFIDYLRSRHMRLTSERLAIVEVVAKHTGLFSVEELHGLMSREAFPVSMATLYNNIELMLDAGIVKCLRLPDRQTALYRMDLGNVPHVYLICEQCGAIKDVSGKTLARYLEQHAQAGFRTRTFMLTVFGLCRKCARIIS